MRHTARTCPSTCPERDRSGLCAFAGNAGSSIRRFCIWRSLLSEDPHYTVRLLLPDDEEVELEVATDEAIWDAARKAGRLLPYGCLQGWCLSCAGRVLEGDFDPSQALRYYEIDKRERFILLCTATPRSAMTIRTHQKAAMQQHRLRHKLPTPRG